MFVRYTPNFRGDITSATVLLKDSFTLRVDDPGVTVNAYRLKQVSAMGFQAGDMDVFKNNAYGSEMKGPLIILRSKN